MAEQKTLARPYAKAAFEFSLENGKLEEWMEALIFLSKVVADPLMSRLLDSPSLSQENAAKAVLAVAGDYIDDKASNLVKLLSTNDRLELLPEILELFQQHRAEFEKTIEVELRSAIELTEQQITDFNSRLEIKLGRKVNINCQIDPTVMGGIIIRAGDLVIDASIRGKLNDLAGSLSV